MNYFANLWRSFWSSIPVEPIEEPDWSRELARTKGIPRHQERMNGLAVLYCGHSPNDWDHQFLRCSVCEQLRKFKEHEHDVGGEG